MPARDVNDPVDVGHRSHAAVVAAVALLAACGTSDTEVAREPAAPRPTTPQPTPHSGLEAAAHELLPASYRLSGRVSGGTSCARADGSRVRCAFLQASGGDRLGLQSRAAVVAAARAHHWRPLSAERTTGGSTTLVFRRDGLEGRVLLARSADVAIVTVMAAAPAPKPAQARFRARGLEACARFDAALARIPRSLSREEGVRRVRAAWRALVVDLDRLTPPTSLARRHRMFLADLRAFERALLPARPAEANAAARQIERSARAVGLRECVPD